MWRSRRGLDNAWRIEGDPSNVRAGRGEGRGFSRARRCLEVCGGVAKGGGVSYPERRYVGRKAVHVELHLPAGTEWL